MQTGGNLFPTWGLTHRFHGSRVHCDLSLPALRQEGFNIVKGKSHNKGISHFLWSGSRRVNKKCGQKSKSFSDRTFISIFQKAVSRIFSDWFLPLSQSLQIMGDHHVAWTWIPGGIGKQQTKGDLALQWFPLVFYRRINRSLSSRLFRFVEARHY